ncbi:MAG: dihydrolipoamide acetyltransferase family protein [Dehalococcoidia bacterium]
MAQTIELPQVGESVVEGTIGKWLKQPGDQVERYEPLVEVVTDKVTMELPSPVKGELVRILAQEGETVPMGAAIAEVETADGSSGVAPAAPAAPTAAAVAPATEAEDAAESPGRIGYFNQSAQPVGPTGGGMVEEAEPPVPDAAPAAVKDVGRLSPAVRRLAREHGIDVARISGTGMGGRITRDDVLKFLETGAAQPAPAPAAATAGAAATPEAPAPTPTEAGVDEEYVTLTPVRRMIAEAMVRSVSQIPHAWSTVEVDITDLVALRARLRREFEQREGVDLTYLPFVMKAVSESLRENPTVNATWGGDKIILKKRINLGIAVAAPNGLVVPVVHNADRLSIPGLAHALRDLTQRARDNKLVLEDVQGGTFTLNNTGVLGSTVSQPIINYPQAAIMTTEAIQKRPMVINDAIAIRSMMNLCMSFDHRINDGAEASLFMQAVKRRLEAIGPDTSI